MKYRKKPVTIEAFQYDGDLVDRRGDYCVPAWAEVAHKAGILFSGDQGEMYIKTLEGNMLASVGDYIIAGVQGEIYACKPDIFEMTYELAE